MSTASHTTGPAARVRFGANSPVHELRGLVVWAVGARKRSMQYGWSRLSHSMASVDCDRLTRWASTHFQGGADAVKAFDRDHGMILRLVMPGNAAGKAKLQQYERLLFNL